MAMRLSPYYADWYRWVLGRSYRLAGRPHDSISIFKMAHRERSNALVPLVELAMSYGVIGNLAKGREAAADILELQPRFSARVWAAVPAYKDKAQTEEDLMLLRVLGLSD
jgi:predicted Zn-dependent protease